MASVTTTPQRNETLEQTLSVVYLFAGPALAFVVALMFT